MGPSGGVGWSLVRSYTLAPERGGGFVCVIGSNSGASSNSIMCGHVEQVLSIQSIFARRSLRIQSGYHRI